MGTAVPGTLRTQPFMPQFRYSELYYGKRYVGVVKNIAVPQHFFYSPLCRNSAIRNFIMESGIKAPNYHSLRMQATVDGATSFYY